MKCSVYKITLELNDRWGTLVECSFENKRVYVDGLYSQLSDRQMKFARKAACAAKKLVKSI